MTCPLCGRGPGRQADADLERKRVCWACHETFIQKGPGRAKITCGKPECLKKRLRYSRAGYVALDRMRDG